MSDQPESYKRAEERVEKKLGFYVHLAVYVLVNAVLITIDLSRSPDSHWFYWPLIGWGIGLAMHAADVFGGGIGSKMKQRMVERELERESDRDEKST